MKPNVYRIDLSRRRDVTAYLTVQGMPTMKDLARLRKHAMAVIDGMEEAIEDVPPLYPTTRNDHRTVSVRLAGTSVNQNITETA